MTVTVQGASGTLTITPGTGDILGLAEQIRNLLQPVSDTHRLQIVSDTAGGTSLPSAPPLSGTHTSILDLTSSVPFDATIPADYSYVVNDTSAPSTLTGSNVAIISGTVGASINVSGFSTVAAVGGDNTVSAGGNYVLSFGPGNNEVNAHGTGTVATGSGQSTIVSAGAGDNLILSNGTNDLIVAATGSSTVFATGSNAGVLGSGGQLVAVMSGDGATVAAGQSKCLSGNWPLKLLGIL